MQQDTQAKTSGHNRAVATFEQRGLNDSQVESIEQIKTNAAALWYNLDNIAVAPGNSDSGRLVSLAKTSLEEAVMWATKAVSRQNPPKERA